MDSLFDLDEISEKNNRIKELEKLIKKYQASYYNGEAEIEDSEFDKLWDELKVLSPTSEVLQKVGADSGNFAKVHHVMPMGSQEKAADPQAFMAWALKHAYPEYLVEYKLDGASLELQYENGVLIHAVTRGDGSVGDDITSNAKKMNGVMHELRLNGEPVLFTGGIRGEVIMTHQVHKEYFSDKANCRNAANGLMKKKDGKGSEYLKLITYDAFATSGDSPFDDEEKKINWLSSLGFYVSPLKICKSPEEVIDYRAYITDMRKQLEYDIDGLVVKERVINMDDAFRARPDRQIAFKFSLEEAVSTLREVEWSISGSTYTPVAIFDEVELNGTKVQRASLANPDTMRKLGVMIGSKVLVVKRGEIIPKIERTVSEEGLVLSEIPVPCDCEVCGTKLIDEGSRLYCPNKDCSKRVLHRLLKFQSVVDIRDFGVTLIENLFKDKKIQSVSDIYTLTKEDLVPYFLNQESQEKEKDSLGAEKVYNSIQSHKNMNLATLIAGFDIDGLGLTQSEKLVSGGFNTLEKLLSATEDEISSIYGFAEISSRTIVEGLKENAEELKYLSENVLTVTSATEGKLNGLSFCFTGELSMKRADAEKLVKEKGGAIKSSVTKDLSYLVTNDTQSGSSKNEKARKLGIPVIDEKQFMDLVQ